MKNNVRLYLKWENVALLVLVELGDKVTDLVLLSVTTEQIPAVKVAALCKSVKYHNVMY